MQRPQLPLLGLLGKYTLLYLGIHFIIRLFRYRVYLRFAHFSDADPIVPAEQFQIGNVFQNMPAACTPVA